MSYELRAYEISSGTVILINADTSSGGNMLR